MRREFTDINIRDKSGKTPLCYATEKGHKVMFNKLLSTGADISVVDKDKNTLLHLACKGGNIAIVEHLLSFQMFDINAENKDHRTPLLNAAYSGHTDVCHHLICVGADPYIQDKDENDVLLVAAGKGDKPLIEYIISASKMVLLHQDCNGKTAPLIAAEKGHCEIFHLFIREDVFSNYDVDSDGGNILHAACTGGNEDIVRKILSLKMFDINSRDRRGMSPVMLAVEEDNQEVFEVLVHGGCDLTAADNGHRSILHIACAGSVDMVESILSHNKVLINIPDSRLTTPVILAAENGKREIFDLLVSKRCHLSVVNRSGYNILHAASFGGSTHIVSYVLSKNIVDINSRDGKRRSSIMLAAERGKRDIFNLLAEKGSDLSVSNIEGQNILHSACVGGSIDIVRQIMFKNIANIEGMDRSGRTPVMLAAEKGHNDVFKLLLSKGSNLTRPDDINTKPDYLETTYDDLQTPVTPHILHYACIGGSVYIVQTILSLNIVDINSCVMKTPVMLAAENGHKAVFDLLMKNGCNLLCNGGDDDTLLHAACIGNSLYILQCILSQNKIDINSKGCGGRTPALLAAERGHREVFDVLVSEGCNLSVVDNDGNTILHAACIGGNVHILQYVLSQKLVDINCENKAGRTPQKVAELNRHTRAVQLLKKRGGHS